ncbi:hypothetical protein ACLOJK_030431 [Asimina triloba]
MYGQLYFATSSSSQLQNYCGNYPDLPATYNSSKRRRMKPSGPQSNKYLPIPAVRPAPTIPHPLPTVRNSPRVFFWAEINRRAFMSFDILLFPLKSRHATAGSVSPRNSLAREHSRSLSVEIDIASPS